MTDTKTDSAFSEETITRMRNAFARMALEYMSAPQADHVRSAFALPFSNMIEADWREAVRLWRTHAAELLLDVPRRDCPACGSTRARSLFESYDGHTFSQCDDCGCWFVPRAIDTEVFDRLFTRCPAAAELARGMMRGREDSTRREADLARIGAYFDDLQPLFTQEEVSYLDTGCGVGHSLRAGLRRGWTVQGIEADAVAVELARTDGLPVSFPNETIPRGPYQLLSFWETLEHIAAPHEALCQWTTYLADDGIVAITVPNLNALATRILREACAWVYGGYNTPGHLNLFHVPSITRLLERAGLSVVDVDGQFSTDPIEVAAFLHGGTRGAFDAIDPSLPPLTMSESMRRALMEIGPGVALLERLVVASPILRVIACRTSHKAEMIERFATRRAAREMQIADAAHALIAYEVDYKSRAEALEREVDIRDRLITDMQGTLNALQSKLSDAERQLSRETGRFRREGH